MHSRESLYRFLWEHRNQKNVIDLSQGEVAEKFGISYQRLSIVMKEFVEMGLISKHRHEFLIRYHPDRIPWGDKFDKFRSGYLASKKKENL